MLVAVIICLMLSAWTASIALAQSGIAWNEPKLLFVTGDDSFRPATVVCDRFGNLHALWSARPDGEERFAIYYMRHDGERWSEPIDIAVDASPMAVRVDSHGYLHLISTGFGLFHSSAPAWLPITARSWTPLTPIDPNIRVLSATAEIDQQDRIHVVYTAGSDPDYTMYYTRSDDGGASWLQPLDIARPSRYGTVYWAARMFVADDGTIHVVWSETQIPEGGPLGVRYAQSRDDGFNWSNPVELTEEGYEFADVAVTGQQVLVLWNARVGFGSRYYRVSNDGGVTWSDIQTLVENGYSGALLGYPNLEVIGPRHIVLVMSATNRATDGNLHDMLYAAEWRDGQWGHLENISGESGQNQNPAACLSLGNRLHVVWARSNVISHVQGELTAPAIAPAEIPSGRVWEDEAVVRAPLPLNSALVTITKSDGETQPDPILHGALRDAPTERTNIPFAIAFIPTVVLVLGVVVFELNIRRRLKG